LTPNTTTGFPEVTYNVWNDGGSLDRPIGGGVRIVAGHDLRFERGNAQILNQDRHDFTLAASVKPQGTGWTRVVSKGDWGDTSGYALFSHDGRFSFGLGGNATAGTAALVTTAGQFGDGAWHQVTVVVDRQAATITMYVDGLAQQLSTSAVYCGIARAATVDISGCPLLAASSNYPFTVGSHNGTNEYFVGAIDQVRVWSRALSAAEVVTL
jgi:hypothetical protein